MEGISTLKVHGKGCPHVYFVKRKPMPLGIYFKCMADGKTNVMLKIELQEGLEDQYGNKRKKKKYTDKWQATTACTLRLAEYWNQSGRLVLGDSWFASVKTMHALNTILGLFFIGEVKNIHSGFPRKRSFVHNW